MNVATSLQRPRVDPISAPSTNSSCLPAAACRHSDSGGCFLRSLSPYPKDLPRYESGWPAMKTQSLDSRSRSGREELRPAQSRSNSTSERPSEHPMDSHESHRRFDAIRLPVKPLFTGAAAVAFKSRRQKARLDISRKQRLGDRRKEYTWSPVGSSTQS